MTLNIGFDEGEAHLDWLELAQALEAGHRLPKAQIQDGFLYRGEDTFLQRTAWIDGLGIAIKPSTIFPGNPAKGKPLIHGVMSVFDDDFGTLEAIVDFFLVTKWKTAADSLLAAQKLARPESKDILILGAGGIAQALHDAYQAAFPQAQFAVWARSKESADRLIADRPHVAYTPDLEAAIRRADIVTSATPSKTPLIRGNWLRPGQHIDLVGAFRPDQREADDTVFERGIVYLDCFETVIGLIGEVLLPMNSGALSQDDIVADFYDLPKFKRQSEDEITVFKNGGGAHLDLMTARYVMDKVKSA